MALVDEVQLQLSAGHGGRGAVSFRRERYVPRGGPDGGDGGRGGSILLIASRSLSSLHHLLRQPRRRAEDGEAGRGGLKHGRAGKDLRLEVPVGTVVFTADTGQVIGDLAREGEELVVARGGFGGRGNARFKSSSQQAPRMAMPGLPGEELTIRLELKLIADIGLVGAPNAGKSSLLRAMTAATPKVGAYPFTTLDPELGVAEGKAGAPLILADIPGLIAGAATGAGLGLRFLRHIERTRLILYVVDGAAAEPQADLAAVIAELKAYSPTLIERPSIIAFNKVDLPAAQARQALSKDPAICWTSALSGEGISDLRDRLIEAVAAAPPGQTFAAPPPITHLRRLTGAPQVERRAEGFRISSSALERLITRSDLDSVEGLEWFQLQLDRLGISTALEAAGATLGDKVTIGEFEFEYQP
ncbi:MAG: GTPase ObgE [Candidatus Dormibacteraceae bacterium]